MQISLSTITSVLKKEKISFEVLGQITEELAFTPASIFQPVNGGLYFVVGDLRLDEVEHSLIISNTRHSASELSNTIIVVDEDPQVIYYAILKFKYKRVSNGMISENAIIDKEAIIGKNVQIDPFAVIGKCRIGDNAIISSFCKIHDNTSIGAFTIVDSNCSIGTQGVAWVWSLDGKERVVQPQLGGVEIQEHCFLGSHTVVVRGSLNENSIIGKCTLMAPGSRIGHGTKIGAYCHLANAVVTGGNTQIGGYSFIGSSATFVPRVKLHSYSIVGAGAVVTKDTSQQGLTLVGVPAIERPTKKHPKGMPKPKNNKLN